MANSWNETIADVNAKLSEMNTAISEANGAAVTANEEAAETQTAAEAAEAAAQAANDAAEDAQAEKAKWDGMTVEATTLAAGSAATVALSEKDGVKRLAYGIPRGKDGADGEKGDTGKSGVTFTLSGTTLYIKTEG